MSDTLLRTNIDFSRNFIRGAARLVIADLSKPFPTRLEDVIRKATTSQNEVQTVTLTGTPTAGTFTLTFKGYTTAAIAYDADAATVEAALEALGSIGTGGVAVTGTGPWVVTFSNQLGAANVPTLVADGALLTGGTTPAAGVAVTTAGFGQYDAHPGWQDIGSTKGGIRVLRNNAEETFDVDQIQAEIASQPTSWEMNVSTQVAEVDIDIMQYLWEGGDISIDVDEGERFLPLGTPTSYRQKRLVVLFQRVSPDAGVTAGGIQGYCFRITQRSPQESAFTFNKTGEQVSVPFQWRCLADSNVTDQYARFGGVLDEV